MTQTAKETILLVDDVPANLKIIAIALRSEGYRVHLASNAEQALTMLQTIQPNMMLVDIQLPGMDGYELTRVVKRDARNEQILVVALTAFTDRTHEEQAFAAGCDGFLTKPINTRTVAQNVREILDGKRDPRAGESTNGAQHFDGAKEAEPEAYISGGQILEGLGPELDSLRHAFLQEGVRYCRRLLSSLDSGFDMANATLLAHRWTGAAGTLGYQNISEQARRLGEVLESPRPERERLRDALVGLGSAFAEPREAAETALPTAIVQSLAGKRVALVGFADAEAERVCVALEWVNSSARVFPATEPVESHGVEACSVVLVHVRPETMSTEWLGADFAERCEQAIVLVGGREHLLALDPAVQFRACEFLIDGWLPEEAAMRLSLALARADRLRQHSHNGNGNGSGHKGKAPILVVDDDLATRFLVQAAFESIGMECLMAEDAAAASRLVHQRKPKAMVLDVNMPGKDGFQVLEELRGEQVPVKVVLLTARQGKDDVLRGFALGADDYVVKPFSTQELVARVRRLL